MAGPPAHLAEGFGRFNPAEFARFSAIARSSLMESRNHLRDALDEEYIEEETRAELDALAELALAEVTGLIEYLQSPEALQSTRRARERPMATRHARRSQAALAEVTADGANSEPRTEPEHQPRSQK